MYGDLRVVFFDKALRSKKAFLERVDLVFGRLEVTAIKFEHENLQLGELFKCDCKFFIDGLGVDRNRRDVDAVVRTHKKTHQRGFGPFDDGR